MKTPFKVLLLLSAILTLSRSSQAEVVVTVNHNEDAAATEAFRFQTVPSPRPTAATGATFKLVDGEPDDITSVDVLHDGKVPNEEDQPDTNFFFKEENDGGRLLVDLGKVVPVKEVDTYSWHPSTRAPQVYKLYGSDGTGAGFVPEPKRPQDPAQRGWKLLATVDTRKQFKGDGGQYGVRVADPAEPLGSYRYLLFDVARTEDDDGFGNTFYSEINVTEAVAAEAVAAEPARMGVGIEPASDVLRAQLSLEPGSGLAVGEVVADSPAARAGLQVNDVLTRFNDQVLVSPEQLITLVGAQPAGDTVRVSYVRRAQPAVAEVKLEAGKRPAGTEAPVAAQEKVTVTVDHNEDAAATDAFKFKTVPSPRPSAALGAAFKVADGEPDANGATEAVLHDGKLPQEEDQPDANFFFQEGSDGGQVMMDLGKVVPIKEVDTYSWHPSTRAPQVYKLFGRETSDEKSEWKLIAEVDTRKKFGDAGGQYGVKVDAGNGIVGRYRYLNFHMARTEDDDGFGNTFYSEINVMVDGEASAPAPSTPPAAQTSHYDREKLHLVLTNDAANFDPKEKERLVETFFAVYPRMATEFNHDAPNTVKILLDPTYRGVAETEGATIRCNPAWFRDHPEDLDVITHEGMHVVQQYRQWEPGWITEGIADYARAKFGVNNAAGDWAMPAYDSKQSYQDAYKVTARFFVWLEKHVKPGIVVTLDQTMREAKYTPGFWTQQTGKNVDELWQNYGKNPAL